MAAPELAASGQTNDANAGTAVRSVWIVAAATAIAAVGMAGLFTAVMWYNAFSTDYPWLWRGGQEILALGSLPATDTFSWTFVDKPVVQYQWRFMVLVAAVERVAGTDGLFAGLIAAAVAVYVLVPLYLGVPRRVPATLVVCCAGYALTIASINLSVRPMIATSAFLALQFALVRGLRAGRIGLPVALGLTAAMYALWANLHTGVILGLVSLALFALGDLAERRGVYRFEPEDPAAEGSPLTQRRYLLLGAAAALASLVNPYGIGIHLHVLGLSGQEFHNAAIEELQSADFHIAQFKWFLFFVGGFFLLLMRTGRVFAASDVLHLAVATIATLLAGRFIVWSALLYGLILPRALHHAWTARTDLRTTAGNAIRAGGAAARRWATAALVVFWIGLASWLALAAPAVPSKCDIFRPAALAYNALKRPTDRLFTGPVIGSCMIADLPGVPLFIDTRFDFYGDAMIRQVYRALRLSPGWQDLLDEWRIDTAAVERDWPLAQALAEDPRFAVLFEDDAAIILRRVR
jgi:hypothetical protein